MEISRSGALTSAAPSGRWFPGHGLATRAHRTAIVHVPSGDAQSYGELDGIANRTSHLLRDCGAQDGDNVCLWFDNDLLYPALWWGAHYAGLYYTLISARLGAKEAAYIVGNSGSAVMLMGRRLFAEHGDQFQSLIGDAVTVIVDDDTDSGLHARLGTQSCAPLTNRTDGMALFYSSGTTGVPKAVKADRSGAALGTAEGVTRMATQMFAMTESSVYLSPAPLYHAAPYMYVSAATALGAQVVVMAQFDAEALLAAIEKYRVTHVQLVPTMFVRLLALPSEVRERYDLSSLRCAIHAAAPCPIPIKEAMWDWWGPIIHEYYSGTEGAGMTYCSPADWITHKGSVGRPVMGIPHIVDDQGVEVGTGVEGTIYFEGGRTFEYLGDAAKTAAAQLPNGWRTYGDVGRLDVDGFLYLTDRRTDLILVGGVNVYPQEAENVLLSHPGVLDAAVFGVPNPEYGQEVRAVVVPVDLPSDDDALKAQLIDACRAELAKIKCPRTIELRDSLPRTPTGKLLRRELRAQYQATPETANGERTAQ
jgi:long-chain acyl-CoA synthetase